MAASSPEFPDSLRHEQILLCSESLGPINGVSRTTTNIILSLQAQDVPMKLVAPHYINSKSRPPLPVGPVRRLGGIPLPYTPELTVAYPFRLDRICASFKPALVYLASPASVGYQVLFQLRCMADPPVVMANFQTDLSAYADVLLPSPLDRYCTWMLRWGEGFLYRFDAVHTVFYPSSPVRRYLLDAGVPASKLVHLGRGVDVDLFNPRHRDEAWRRELAPNGELIIVCVGRLAPEKGFPFLAKAAQRLAERDVPFRLVIVGGNRNATVEDDVRARFEPIRRRVTFTGFLEGEALARAYASADVFAHCSVTETFGLVVLEAMGCGLPVVARDAGGPSEIVRDGRSGFLTPPDDLDAFVERLQRLARRAGPRNEMALAARAQAEDTTWDSINARVAQRMALALEDRRKEGKRFRPLDTGNQALNWVVAFFAAIWTELLWSGTMLVVTFFWTITVIPLIVHGNIVFGARRQDSGPKSKVGPGLVRA